MTPSSKFSTSNSPFCVSTVAITSPRLTRSPGLTSHSTSVPASMSAPRLGMRNSPMGHHPFCCRDNGVDLRQGSLFHVPGIGDGNLGAAEAHHRQIQLVEGLFHDPGRYLGGD